MLRQEGNASTRLLSQGREVSERSAECIKVLILVRSAFFRDMFQAGTRGGPLGIDEVSKDFAFILDRVTRKQSKALPWEVRKPKLSEIIIRLEPITRKYMFEATNALLRRMITRCVAQCPPQVLGYALSCQPPDRSIAMSALESFENQMTGPEMMPFFFVNAYTPHLVTGKLGNHYSPAAHNLRWSFVKDELGIDGYYAYSLALQEGRSSERTWDWKKVAQALVEQLKLPEVDEWSC